MFAISKVGATTLLKTIAEFQKDWNKAHDDAHVLAVSSLYHAAAHGDTRPLQNLFNVFGVNYQTALTQYVTRIQKETPGVAFLNYSKADGWTVKKNVEAEKKAFLAFADENLINPDGQKYKRFYERNIIVEAILLDDKRFAQQLKTLLKKAKGERQNVTANVDPKLVRELETLVAHAEQTAGVEATAH